MESAIQLSASDRLYIKRIIAWEWIRCLVSPRHAATTWLRIDPKVEQRILLILKRAVIALFVAVVFVIGMGVGELRMLHHINTQQAQPTQIHLRAGERSV